ncbi:N-formylglutamate amidohydrolase [Legionella fallonii]|uniref:N-formylglutamate amidohydrolase n=1 Tax=Legionella fallonii LLAP-10 TaxID=1212491 RepID=A0A098G809_9GAMM|nr:N-formylglutamate amidohydrolase [Legionella fallonii]CEG58104.1 conserved protein of unknown function [Legionella fallonii LLAP-10]
MKKFALVISCEHAVDTVPGQYLPLFASFKPLLASHRGIDFGALTIAEYLTKQIPSDFIKATCTRLLIDCNKSINHPRCFSEVTQNLSTEEKQKIMDNYYWPFRLQTMDIIKHHIEHGSQVLHLSVHSFTPILNGIARNADIGILYDPQRSSEKRLASQWRAELKKLAPEYKIRMNYPYKGISDGFTRMMRKQYTDMEYIGIELESNQAITLDNKKIDNLKIILADSLLKLIYS